MVSTGSKKPGFAHHPAAAKKAFDAGDHSTAMPHIGHQMRIAKSGTTGATAMGAEPDVGDSGSGNWIQGMQMKKGALHAQLGVPQGQKIPPKQIASAADSSNPLLAKRAQLAQ